MMTIQILPALYYEITVFCIPSIGMYTDTESDEILSGSYARFAEEMHCPFVAVLADPGCSASVRENVYKAVVGARVAQKYRTIPIDLFYDIERIGNIISPPSSIIGFKPDGSIYNIGSDGNPLEHNTLMNLSEIS